MVLISSCREEIIPPGNPAGNINEPVLEKYIDYYSFKINASNLTLSMSDFAYFNALTNYLSFTLIDHNSGSVDVLIWNKSKSLYNTRFSRDFERTTIVLDGNVPEFIQIKLNDFTGKISIQLSRY
jgi:hypothetical protein